MHYRDGDEREKRAVIDDLKYGGADKILTRLMDNFEGELVERVQVASTTASDEGEKPDGDDSKESA